MSAGADTLPVGRGVRSRSSRHLQPVVVLWACRSFRHSHPLLYIILLILRGKSSADKMRRKEKLEQEKQEKLRQEQTIPRPRPARTGGCHCDWPGRRGHPVHRRAFPEVVAAIAAAVAEESQGQYVLENVSVARTLKSPDRRGRWVCRCDCGPRNRTEGDNAK